MRRALRRLLRANGCEAVSFADGESFLAAHAEYPFDCLLLDLHMPGLNGFAVLRALAGLALRPAVIVLTGHDDPGNEERVSALGATAYLLKPVDESPLMAAIGRSLGGSSA